MKLSINKTFIKAYFTVEAALIFPVVLSVILFVLYIMIYQYDRCLLEQDVGILSFRGSISHQENKILVEELEEEADRIYFDKYVAFSWDETNISAGYGKINVEVKGRVKAPFSFSVLNQPFAEWNIQASSRNQQTSPVLIIRAIHKILNSKGKEE